MTDKGRDLITGNLDDPDFFVLPDVGAAMAEIQKSDLSAENKQEKKALCRFRPCRIPHPVGSPAHDRRGQ